VIVDEVVMKGWYLLSTSDPHAQRARETLTGSLVSGIRVDQPSSTRPRDAGAGTQGPPWRLSHSWRWRLVLGNPGGGRIVLGGPGGGGSVI
jgi:hypothetical protein